MDTEEKIENPTQVSVEQFAQRTYDEKRIRNRMVIIVEKIDIAYKEIYKIDPKAGLQYLYYFNPDNTIGFVVQYPELNMSSKVPGTLPLSCCWSDTDLHINLEMMKSDIVEERVKYMKVIKEGKTNIKPLTTIQKIKNWLGV